jgi:hypothetical protein
LKEPETCCKVKLQYNTGPRIPHFYHPAENIYSFGKYLFQWDKKQYTLWAEEFIGLLRKSGAEEVMRRLERYKGKVRLPFFHRHPVYSGRSAVPLPARTP